MSELISIREFSRRIGISDVAVLKAIKAGKITEASIDRSNPKRPKIKPDSALREWGKNYDPTYAQSEKLLQAIEKAEPAPVPPVKAARPKSDVPANAPKDGPEPVSIAEAKRQSAIYDSKLKGLELAERQKILVPRNKVFDELFAFGQELKTSMLAIPDKYIDLILATTNRAEAHTILYTAITESLETLSRSNELKF